MKGVAVTHMESWSISGMLFFQTKVIILKLFRDLPSYMPLPPGLPLTLQSPMLLESGGHLIQSPIC